MIAVPLNRLGQWLQDRAHHGAADAAYSLASRVSPGWSAPHFNRGLMAKFAHDWQGSFRHTLKATELDPSFMPAWWNLGIAATALSDWPVARRAWWRYGIEVPLGEGPPDMALGAVPIRICPRTTGEVVWCRRIDPARAVIESVPTPESGHACGDTLLTDGEPRGYRLLGSREVPVFDELEILVRSKLSTYSAEVVAPTGSDAAELESSAHSLPVVAEDWSGLRAICAACSEGRPHDRHAPPDEVWNENRSFGLAAEHDPVVHELLSSWVSRGPGRVVISVECVLSRGSSPGRPAAWVTVDRDLG